MSSKAHKIHSSEIQLFRLKRNCLRKVLASICVHAFEKFVLKFTRFFLVFASRIEIEREIRLRVYVVRSPCTQRIFRLRDFEMRLKGNIPPVFRAGCPMETPDTPCFHSLLLTSSKIQNKRQRSESKRWHECSSSKRAERAGRWREGEGEGGGGSSGSRERERGRAVRKICQDLRARNSPHGCPKCKEFFVPLSLALGDAATPVKTVRDGYVPIFRWRVTVNYSLTVNPPPRCRKLRVGLHVLSLRYLVADVSFFFYREIGQP